MNYETNIETIFDITNISRNFFRYSFYNLIIVKHINKKINELAINYFDGNNSKFADFMGTSEANIRNYRRDTLPKLDFVVKLCEKLEISFDSFLFEKESDNVIREPSVTYNISDKDMLIQTQAKLISSLEERISFLSEELKKQKKEPNTSSHVAR